jgi:hypothetical protein
LGCRGKSGEDPPYLGNQLDLNLRLRLDVREDPQMMEKDPQPIPRISKVVGCLQAYIRRPYHGERRDREIEKHLTYDLIRKDIARVERKSSSKF